jgi:hypothetical protein
MARQRITDPRDRLLGYVEEAHGERKLVLLDAVQRRLGWFSPETNITVGVDGTVVGKGNRLLHLLPADGPVRIEPEQD